MPAAINASRETDMESLKSICDDIRQHVVSRKRLVDEEIRTYPTPIPRCDAQFNFLLDEQIKLSDLLRRLPLAAENLPSDSYFEVIENFITSSETNDDAELTFRSQVKARLSLRSLDSPS